MKILHNQSQLKRVFLLGVGNVIIGFGSLFTTASQYLVGLGGLGVVFILHYFYTKNKVLIELTNESISYYGFLKKKTILVNEIISYKYFAGDHTITSQDNTIVININWVDKASQMELKSYFDTLKSKL
jgi:hypothetical protein